MGLFEVLKDTTDSILQKTTTILQDYTKTADLISSYAKKTDLSAHTGISGTASQNGHTRLSDAYASKIANGAAANGMAASQNALYHAYNNLNTNILKCNIIYFAQRVGANTEVIIDLAAKTGIAANRFCSCIPTLVAHSSGGVIHGHVCNHGHAKSAIVAKNLTGAPHDLYISCTYFYI